MNILVAWILLIFMAGFPAPITPAFHPTRIFGVTSPMVTYKTICRSMAFLALTSIVVGHPAHLMAAAPTGQAKVIDVALHGQNELHGRILDAEGKAASGTVVVLTDGQNVPLVRTVSDEEGRFAFGQVPAGTAVLYAGQTQTHMRTWTTGTAPPKASQEVVIDQSQPVVRGQFGGIDARSAAILTAWGVALGVGVFYGIYGDTNS
ncbi:MAG: carboxypeptidase-like regulatory domain-containing protein [Pirellulales bacterium]|nr:carboxypeptidase-like regulatory domain-containing protein [Pirellulales bacterium]